MCGNKNNCDYSAFVDVQALSDVLHRLFHVILTVAAMILFLCFPLKGETETQSHEIILFRTTQLVIEGVQQFRGESMWGSVCVCGGVGWEGGRDIMAFELEQEKWVRARSAKACPEGGGCRKTWAGFSGGSTQPYQSSFNKNMWYS